MIVLFLCRMGIQSNYVQKVYREQAARVLLYVPLYVLLHVLLYVLLHVLLYVLLHQVPLPRRTTSSKK
jgi:hypothetical protein